MQFVTKSDDVAVHENCSIETSRTLHVLELINADLRDFHGPRNAVTKIDFLPLCPPIPPLYFDPDPYKT